MSSTHSKSGIKADFHKFELRFDNFMQSLKPENKNTVKKKDLSSFHKEIDNYLDKLDDLSRIMYREYIRNMKAMRLRVKDLSESLKQDPKCFCRTF